MSINPKPYLRSFVMIRYDFAMFRDKIMHMNKNDILIIHGKDYVSMTKQLLEAARLDELIGDRHTSIGLKPNLVNSSSPSYGATTHTEIAKGTVQYLLEHGFSDISVMEGSWVGERTENTFEATGFKDLCMAYDLPFYDMQKDTSSEYDTGRFKLRICDKAMSVGFMINMPVLKGHCQTGITCALKNNKGIIPDSEKRRYHREGIHAPVAYLNTVAKNDFIIVDNICGDLDFEEGGNPVVMNRILAFRDPVLCDSYVCSAMGYSPDDVQYVRLAEKLGVGSCDLSKANITMLNKPGRETGDFPRSRKAERLAAFTDEDMACSACYGSLIHALARIDESGRLKKNFPAVSIGQGFRGKKGKIGVGNCTAGFEKSCPGCPPQASDIRRFLEKL